MSVFDELNKHDATCTPLRPATCCKVAMQLRRDLSLEKQAELIATIIGPTKRPSDMLLTKVLDKYPQLLARLDALKITTLQTLLDFPKLEEALGWDTAFLYIIRCTLEDCGYTYGAKLPGSIRAAR